MPITVYYNNNSESPCTIRPTPLISVNSNILKNGAGEAFGITYTITLNGKIIHNEGTPFAFKTNDANSLFDVYDGGTTSGLNPANTVGPYCSFDKTILHNRPPSQQVDAKAALGAIFSKQKSLRALFSIDGQRTEITDWVGLDENAPETQLNPVMIFYPRITNITFPEGQYTDTAEYTITMEADTLLSNTSNISADTSAGDFTVDTDATLLMATSGLYNVSGIYGIERISEAGPVKYKIAPPCEAGEEEEEEGEGISEGPAEQEFRLDQMTEEILKEFNQSFINDFNEEWSIEVDEQFGENFGDVPLYSNTASNPFRDLIQPKSYIITHTLSANGKAHYGPDGKSEAWKEARKFVQNRLVHSNTKDKPLTKSYPNTPFGEADLAQSDKDGNPNPNLGNPLPGFFGSGALNLSDYYNGFNHSRNEDIVISEGSYSVTETWLVASGTDYENYSMSITSDNQNPFVNINLQGKIKGLSSLVPSSVYFGGQQQDQKASGIDADKQDPRFLVSPYMNALEKWYKISKSGVFGYTSDIYRRANSTVAVELNSQPLDISLGMNEYTGEIDYSLSFDNRPTNIISGTLFENISINETYPGDVFATIPVLGRQTGPVFQYMGSRTAYSRDLTVDLTMDSTKIPYDTGRKMLQRRPSAINPTASQLEKLIHELSPQHEPGIRKYFHDPPQESWNPKTGQYSFSIRWTYELDK